MPESPGSNARDSRRKQWARALIIASLCHLAIPAVITVANALGPDRWWPAALNLYLPQWIWASPSILLLPLALWLARRWFWVPVLSALWVAGPVMGFRWGGGASAPGRKIRVMTYNAQWWQVPLAEPLARKIIAADPDIACIQDVRGAVDAGLRDYLKGWNVAEFGQYVIASKFPLKGTAVGDISFRGEKHTYLRALLNVGGREIVVCSAHFTTPREGLASMRHLNPSGIAVLRRNVEDRLAQAESIARDLRAIRSPIIIAGDLNAPIQSLACRALLNLGLSSVFDAVGRGYGYTYGHTHRFGHSFTRIDHVLVSGHFTPISCEVGEPGGSDHRPVIAELSLAR